MLYLIGAAILYTLAVLLGAISARNANPTLAGGITNLVGAVLPLTIAALEYSRKPFQNTKLGILAAIAGGVVIALFVITINKSFTVNKVGIVTPIVFGGSIFLSAVIGYFLFKEKITPYQIVGLTLLLFGLGFITYARATGR